jgi:hypothetical protein
MKVPQLGHTTDNLVLSIFSIFFNSSISSAELTAKPVLSAFVYFEVFIQISCHFSFTSGQPLLPGFIAASV